MTTLTFNNDASLKTDAVAHAEAHRAADMLRSGTYGQGRGKSFKACSVGCMAHDIDKAATGLHATVASHYALPEWLVRLQDSMFEGLPAGEREAFHVELFKRIPVGVSLDLVPHLIAVARIDRMLVTQRKALEAKHAHGAHEAIEQTITALEIGRRAHEAAAGGNSCELSAAWAAWSAASAAARSAAESAARSAASAAARSAAWSAWSAASAAESAARSAWSAAWSAWSARSAPRSAAWSAARSAAESAAESAAWSAWIEEREALYAALEKAGAP